MMKILITQNIFHKYFRHIEPFARIYNPERGKVQIISNTDVTFNRYRSSILVKPLMMIALKLDSLTTDISLYIADDVLCKPYPANLFMRVGSYYWINNLPSPIQDIEFDIAIIDNSATEKFINYRNKIKIITVYENRRDVTALEVLSNGEGKIVDLSSEEKMLETLKEVIQMVKE
jgi:hypothetical protein